MNQPEVNSIVTRVLRGDIDAYEVIVRAYQHEVWRVLASMLFDRQRTEDLVQQTFINAYKHLDRYQGGREFSVWLKEIARNVARHEIRRDVRENRRLQVYHTQVFQDCESSGSSAEKEGMAEALRACVQKLPKASAEVVELRYQAQKNFGEIAAHLGRSVEATRQHLARIRLGLRECIEKHLAGI